MEILSSHLYDLELEGSHVSVSDYSGEVLSLKEFSRFKYGDGRIAEKYGLLLCQLFVDRYTKILEDDPKHFVIVCPVNKAVTSTIGFFQAFLNSHLFELGKPPIERIEMKFAGRGITRNDYASLPMSERERVLGDVKLVFDRNFSSGKKFIVIDDLKVTGTYENKVKRILEAAGVEFAIFLYVIQVAGEAVKKKQDIESILDHFYVNKLERLGGVMSEDGFVLNQRVCKFILTQKNLKAVREFLENLSNGTIKELYMLSVNEGYGFIKSYEQAFSDLKDVFSKKNNYLLPADSSG